MSIAVVRLDGSLISDDVLLATCAAFEMKAESEGETRPVPDRESEDVDGCDVAVDHATSDEDLPAAEGGVA